MDPGLPAIYCVHLTSSLGRRDRMERRFRHHGFERATLVSAFETPLPRDSSDEWKAMAGRYAAASHLECMRRILAEVPESEGGAIICEDDVLFHDEFAKRLPRVLANLPADSGALLLGFMIAGWPGGLEWSGRDPAQRNLVPILPWETWGAHGYWITHKYAAELVDRLGDVPVEELSDIVEAQLIFPSRGRAAYPPLMLQETVDSVVRPAHELPGHVAMQAAWPYRDYAAAEEVPAISPLAELPDPTRTIRAEIRILHEAHPVERLTQSLAPFASTDIAPADYVLKLDSDMAVEWRGPLPPLTADAYRLPLEGSEPVLALVRSDLEPGGDRDAQDLDALRLKRGFLLNELVEAMFATNQGTTMELEGVTMGVVLMGDGASLALEDLSDGRHRLVKRGAAGEILETSPSFRFSERPIERSEGIAVADDMLVLGFVVDDRHGALAACGLDDALALLRPPQRGSADRF